MAANVTRVRQEARDRLLRSDEKAHTATARQLFAYFQVFNRCWWCLDAPTPPMKTAASQPEGSISTPLQLGLPSHMVEHVCTLKQRASC